MKYAYAALCVVLMVCLSAVAQDAAPAARAGGKAAAKEATKSVAKSARKGRAAKTASAPAAKAVGKAKDKGKTGEKATAEVAKPVAVTEPQGDVITLKSGAVLKGVQVIDRTPTEVGVDVGAGVILKIPSKQVANIKLDNIEPGRRGLAGPPEQKEANLFPGSKLKPEVSDTLTRPLPEPPVKYDNADLVTVLGELSQRLGITILVDDVVKNLPAQERMWSFETKPGMNLMGLLQEDLLQQHKNLAVVYQYDKLLVTTKERAGEMASQETPQIPPAPAPAPGIPAPGAPPAGTPPPPGMPPAAPVPVAPAPVAPPPGTPAAPPAPAPVPAPANP